MPTPDPRPVYIVPAPTTRGVPLRAVLAGVLVIAVGLTLAARPADDRTPAVIPPAGTDVRATPATTDQWPAIDAAAQAARDRFQGNLDAKLAACDKVSGDAAAFESCSASYDALAAKLDSMNACIDQAHSATDVKACETKYRPH